MKLLLSLVLTGLAAAQVPVPRIQGDWWTVASEPELGSLARADQQPVDFAIWEAADGKWQIWSCVEKPAQRDVHGCSIAGKATPR